MSNVLTPAEVETLAKRYGMDIVALCKAADISLATFYRWRKGTGPIKLTTYDALLTALKAAQEQFTRP